jgi:HAD superfamily hydrolase (TIGR01509 family)
MTSVVGAIFDVDGTLLDSNDAHALAYQKALKENGMICPFPKIRRLIGMGGDRLLPSLVGIQEDTDLGKKISLRKGEIFMRRYLANLRPFPKGRELIQALQKRGIQVGIASSAKAYELKQLLKKIEIDDLIENFTHSEEVESSKPDADIVISALQKLNLPANQVLMLGDTPYDIQAARQSGLMTIAFRCGGWTDSDLKQAVKIYQTPQDLLENLDQSPFFWSETQLNQLTRG